MEDAATVEISRMQIWQWIRHGARTTEGVVITRDLVAGMLINETVHALAEGSGADSCAVEAARDILEHGCLGRAVPVLLDRVRLRPLPDGLGGDGKEHTQPGLLGADPVTDDQQTRHPRSGRGSHR